MLVSIIVPYFNDPINIHSSINSALNQTHTKIEIIIIDDENSIKSKKVLYENFKNNKKIRIFTNKNNSGVASARNLGIKKSTRRWIFLNSLYVLELTYTTIPVTARLSITIRPSSI